jgi:glycosyltransferase involved in cell wall biosynthesis
VARNACLDAATAPLVAFIDDDQVASPEWLVALVGTLESSNADVVLGPVQAVYGPDRAAGHGIPRYMKNQTRPFPAGFDRLRTDCSDQLRRYFSHEPPFSISVHAVSKSVTRITATALPLFVAPSIVLVLQVQTKFFLASNFLPSCVT